jgi:hypothetical protein
MLMISDAALMMQLGCDGVFVGSGICESSYQSMRANDQSCPVTPSSVPVPSYRPSPTTTTPPCSPSSQPTSERQWSVSPCKLMRCLREQTLIGQHRRDEGRSHGHSWKLKTTSKRGCILNGSLYSCPSSSIVCIACRHPIT